MESIKMDFMDITYHFVYFSFFLIFKNFFIIFFKKYTRSFVYNLKLDIDKEKQQILVYFERTFV